MFRSLFGALEAAEATMSRVIRSTVGSTSSSTASTPSSSLRSALNGRGFASSVPAGPSPMSRMPRTSPQGSGSITELPAWSMTPIPTSNSAQRLKRLYQYEELLMQFQPGRYVSEKLMQMLMKHGMKNRARQQRDEVMRRLRMLHSSPQQVLVRAVARIAPHLEVKSTKLGAKSVPVPFPISPRRRIFLALKWLIEAAQKKAGTRRLGKSRSMVQCLVWEIRQAIRRKGEPRKRRIMLHKMALKARPYARLRWW